MTTAPFTFPIRVSARQSWALVKRHLGFFVGMSIVTAILSYSGGERTPVLLSIVLSIASFVWSMVWLRVSLAAARNEEGKLSFDSLKTMVPSLKDLLLIIGISIVMVFLILCGFILLIIPGIYISIRLSFAVLAYIDRKEGVMKSLRYSWDITKGGVVWTILATGLAVFGIYLLGLIALVVGLLVAYPVAAILTAKLYLALVARHNGEQTIIKQPTEIPADLPHAEVV